MDSLKSFFKQIFPTIFNSSLNTQKEKKEIFEEIPLVDLKDLKNHIQAGFNIPTGFNNHSLERIPQKELSDKEIDSSDISLKARVNVPEMSTKQDVVLVKEDILKTLKEIDSEEKSKMSFAPFLYMFFGFLFLVFTFLVFKYSQQFFFLKNSSFRKDEIKTVVVDYIFSEESDSLNLDIALSVSEARQNILQKLESVTLSSAKNYILNIYNFKETYNEKNEKTTITEKVKSEDVFFMFSASAPLSLRQVVSEMYAIGLLNIFNKNEKYFVFSVSNVPIAYREMRSYENFIYNDYKNFLNLRSLVGEVKFRDIMSNNHELRALYDEEGIVLVYGFANQKNIIISRDVEVFVEVSKRLR